MNIKLIVSGYLMIVSLLNYGQNNIILPDNGIYKTEVDFLNNNIILGFNKKDANHMKLLLPWKHEVQIKKEGILYHFPYDDIWGFRMDKESWRIYFGQFYKLIYTGKICIYGMPVLLQYSGNQFVYYFSTDLKSPVFELNKSNLKSAYHSDTCFVNKIKSLPFSKSIYKVKRDTGNFEFIDWLE